MFRVNNVWRLVFSRQIRQLNVTRGMASSQASDQQSTKNDMKVNLSLERQQFYIELDPPDRAVLDYDLLSDGSVNMHHTGVPSSYRGRGIAGQLAKAAFSHFSSEQTKMLLTCTYLQKYHKDHPDASTPNLISLPS